MIYLATIGTAFALCLALALLCAALTFCALTASIVWPVFITVKAVMTLLSGVKPAAVGASLKQRLADARARLAATT